MSRWHRNVESFIKRGRWQCQRLPHPCIACFLSNVSVSNHHRARASQLGPTLFLSLFPSGIQWPLAIICERSTKINKQTNAIRASFSGHIPNEPLEHLNYMYYCTLYFKDQDLTLVMSASFTCSRLTVKWHISCIKRQTCNKPKYTKTEDITVTKTDPSLLIFGGGNFQMKWAKKQVSNTLTHFHPILIKM